jgi:hypothetical protein
MMNAQLSSPACLKNDKSKQYSLFEGPTATLPCTEATTGTGKAVENTKERPRDRISLYQLVLLTILQTVSQKSRNETPTSAT